MKNHNIKTARFFVEIIVLGSLVFGVSNVAFATTSQAVTATVKLQDIEVTVADGSINYGTLALSAFQDTLATTGHLNDQQVATNGGNIAEDLSIKGQNAAAAGCTGSPPPWAISSTSTGADQYEQSMSTSTGTLWTPLSTSYITLGLNVATSSTVPFDLKISTPVSSVCYQSQSVDVTVLAACSTGHSC